MDQFDRDAILADEAEYQAFFSEMINSNRLVDQPGLGVVKQWIGKGSASLSAKQWVVVEILVKENIIERCTRCSGIIPWSERYDAKFTNNGYCGYCAHTLQKLLDED